MQIPVRVRARVAGLAFPDECSLVAPRAGQVAVETVVGCVQLAAYEPFGMRGLPLEHPLPRLEPLELARPFAPEGFGVGRGTIIDTGIGGIGLRAKVVRWFEAAVFRQ